MRKSPYPLELDLGMKYYGSDGEGTGGILRSAPEDFFVEEIPVERRGEGSGPYLICELEKRNWELQHAVKEIARRLGISHRRIGWAGTKDRNAVTRQRISLYNVYAGNVAEIGLKDIVLRPVGYTGREIFLGDLKGNRFDIIIRKTGSGIAAEALDRTTTVIHEGVPNYYGIQRFGAIRPVTHRVGEEILRGAFRQAVLTYIGREYPSEPEEIRKIRREFLATLDPLPALKSLPRRMGYERALLHHLQKNPGDYAGALHELPPKLLSMFVSAFQSYLFNTALSVRLEDGISVSDPQPGDQLLFANGRIDAVTPANRHAATLHIARGRCTIALFMPGRAPRPAMSPSDRLFEELLTLHSITYGHFQRASAFVRTKFDGTYRPIALKSDVQYTAGDDSVRLGFTLPPGQYATTVCREYMKADPVCMV